MAAEIKINYTLFIPKLQPNVYKQGVEIVTKKKISNMSSHVANK